jgi:hypothetical protein
MGGDLVVQKDTAGVYQLTLSLYRDILGIPLANPEEVDMYFWNTATNTYTFSTTFFINYNGTLSTALLPNFPYGVEVGIYTYPLPGLSAGKYRFVYHTCCRNGAVQNMSAPLNESMPLYTDLEVTASPSNSTPGFLAMPVTYFPVNSPASYNPLPYDPDADSIAWDLNTPIGNYTNTGGTPVFTSVAGFTAPSAAASGPFTMNPVTGEITWTPNITGNFVQSFEVKEYRNGVQIGSIIRDMQYIVVPGDSNTTPPAFVSSSPYMTNASQGYKYIYYTPGQPLSFTIGGSDQDANTNLQMQSFGTVYQLPVPAVFTTLGSGANISGTFNWTPPAGFNKDMIVVFRLRDNVFTKDFTLLMRRNPTAIVEVGNIAQNVKVFPNPAKDQLYISMDLKQDINGSVSLYSSLGQKVKTFYTGRMMKGSFRLDEAINLAPGVYFLNVTGEGKTVYTQTVVVQ